MGQNKQNDGKKTTKNEEKIFVKSFFFKMLPLPQLDQICTFYFKRFNPQVQDTFK